MAEEKISTLLSDVSVDGNMIEKNKIIVDAKVRGNIEANDLDTHSKLKIFQAHYFHQWLTFRSQ